MEAQGRFPGDDVPSDFRGIGKSSPRKGGYENIPGKGKHVQGSHNYYEMYQNMALARSFMPLNSAHSVNQSQLQKW